MNWLRKLAAWIAGQVQGHIPFFRVGTSTDTGDAAIAEATGSVDSSGNGILHVGNLFAWAYEMVFGTIKTTIFRREVVIVQTHNAVGVAVGAFTSEVKISMRGYTAAIINIKSDQSYDLHYRMDDGLISASGNTQLVAGQSASGTGINQHPVVKANVYLCGDSIAVQAKNVGASTATMSISVTLIP